MPFETRYPYLALANGKSMNAEPCRLKSFGSLTWSQDCAVPAASFAKEGFYYTGRDAIVQCFGCDLQLDGKDTSCQLKRPRALHQERSPTCPLVNGDALGPCNIPLPLYTANGGKAINAIKAYLGGTAIPNASSARELDNDVHNHALELRIQRRLSAQTDSQFPSFSSTLRRSRSFHGFRPVAGIPTDDFTQAGFFFSGVNDTVICHWCGLSLYDWKLGDDPRIAHARLQPGCNYFRCQVGPGFIRDAQQELRTIGM